MSLARQRARVAEVLDAPLLESPWLRRLEGISFLGTLDRHPRSRRASSRFEHSLGVAMLAAEAAAALELDRAPSRVFVAACLLHDIGHYPLSHAAEPAFTKVLGAGHHEVGRWIVLGEGPIPRARSLRPLLELHDIDPEGVWAMIDRGPALAPELAPLAELLQASINLDTLEGISRVARDFRMRAGKLPEAIFTGGGEGLAIRASALAAIDRFWLLKDQVYDRVINLPSNILAEARLCELVVDRVDMRVLDDFEHFDDSALRRRLGERAFVGAALDGRDDDDYELWTRVDYGQQVGASEPTPVLSRVRKRYYVDRSVQPRAGALALAQWQSRYRHERVRSWLVSRRKDQLDLPLDLPRFSEEAPEI
ncbi:HD domain-containing protein [Nannocystaceae bacterium ST9]